MAFTWLLDEHYNNSQPFLWQIDFSASGGGLVNLSPQVNVQLEAAYMDPAHDSHSLKDCGTLYAFDFEHMLMTDGSSGRAPIRRLSTNSYIVTYNDPRLERSGLVGAPTQWRWYYRHTENNGRTSWILFPENSIPSQSVLEKKFLARQVIYHFEHPQLGECRIDLGRTPMKITQCRDQVACYVKRRPLLTNVGCQCPLVKEVLFPRFIPLHWTPLDTEQEAELVPVLRGSQEFDRVATEFSRTLSHRSVLDILRIQNEFLWHKYASKRWCMEQRGRLINERNLFHGLGKTDDRDVYSIARENFDIRLAGQNHGTVFGRGIYFASSARISDGYAFVADRPRSWMFYALVIVGKYAQGDSKIVRPPLIDMHQPHGDRYNSCVDDVVKPEKYVVFDSDQCYPEYAISYCA